MIVFSLLTGKVRIEKIIGDRGEKDKKLLGENQERICLSIGLNRAIKSPLKNKVN
jgi:hypothetical protein